MNSYEVVQLEIGDKLRDTAGEMHGRVYAKAAGCIVIAWQHTDKFDSLLLTSQMWKYLERDK